jgi:hypothetical protein
MTQSENSSRVYETSRNFGKMKYPESKKRKTIKMLYPKSFTIGVVFSIAGMFPLLSCEQKNEIIIAKISSSPVKPELVITAVPSSVDMGPLPKTCEPWKKGPEPRPLKISENPSYADIGLRSDRMICAAYGESIECETFGQLNAYLYELKYLRTQPGGVNCSEPETNDYIECSINVRDQNQNTIETIILVCRGDRFCGKDKANQCCKVKKRGKVFIQAESYSEEDFQVAEEERCDRLDERRKTCEPFCTNSKYSSQCASYWGVVCPNSVAFSEIFTQGM